MHFSTLKPNSKSEFAAIGLLKGVQVAVRGMHCIDLNIDTLKLLGTRYSYNKRLI